MSEGKYNSADKGSLPGFLHAALQSDLLLSAPKDRAEILQRFNSIKTQEDAEQYMQSVTQKMQ